MREGLSVVAVEPVEMNDLAPDVLAAVVALLSGNGEGN